MGMALYSEESVSTSPPWSPSSCSKKAVLKNSLSQMKSLFCKEIDSHLKKLRGSPSLSPSPKKKNRELRAENGEEEGVSRWPLKDQLRRAGSAASSPPPPRPKMSPNKRKGKENVSLGTRKRRRLTTEVVSITSSSSKTTSISTLVNGNNSVHEQSEFNHYSSEKSVKKYNTRKTSKNRTKKIKNSETARSIRNQFPLIKAFRKSPNKFDPSRVRRPDDDPVPPSNNGIKNRKKVFKKKLDMDDIKDTSASVFIPVNRKANIVPGDYRSHGREYFHVRSNSKIAHGEPESEESYQWLPDLMHRQIDEFLDLNNGEKELIKLWNEHMLLDPAYGSEMLSNRLKEFVEKKGAIIASRGLYKNFLLHLTNLYEHEVLDQMCFLEVVLQLQSLMAKMVEKPWHDSWKDIKPAKKAPHPSKSGYAPSMLSSESNHCILSGDPVEPLPTATRQIPSSWLIKKKKKISEEEKNIRRMSSRRSNVLKMSSDVTVKFWGAGDYTSIKDVNQTPLKRKFEPDSEDLSRNGMMNEFKRRKISNGYLHNSSCIDVT